MAITFIDPKTWNAAVPTALDVASWAEASAAKSGSDTGTLSAIETSAVSVPLSASDIGTLACTETTNIIQSGGVVKTGSDTLVLVGVDTATAPLDLTLKSATDTLVLQSFETRQLLGGGFSLSAFDVLVLRAVEAPTGSRLTSTDDQTAIAAAETATSPIDSLAFKTASDTLVLLSSEQFQIVAGGFATVSASDTGTLIGVDTAQQITAFVVKTASDIGVLACVDTVQFLLQSDVRSASDVCTLIAFDTSRPIVAIDAPVVGILPPGWIERELVELTGIERPKRYEPGNVQPIQGWFRRSYWAVYDETGRLRATDRWQKTARAQAWTQYHSGKQAIAA